MNILVVGNVLKDVYLNLDSRTEKFETDKSGTEWLDFSFNASEHRFFNRGSSFGGAAITLEVFKKMGLSVSIADNSIEYSDDEFKATNSSEVYRYILVSDNGVSYLAPSDFKTTIFNPADSSYDYIFIDRSAEIDMGTAKKINEFLDASKQTKLVLYLRNLENQYLNDLAGRAALVFLEQPTTPVSEQTYAPKLPEIPPEKLVNLSEKSISYLKINERLSLEHVDRMTHLSMYSIAAATVLGGFILGESVENSLRMARVNVENSRLDSVLSIGEIKELSSKHNSDDDIELIAASLMLAKKGILAADESGGSIHKKFEQLAIDDTYENRRDYRNIFFTTPDLEKYVNGVILFDETIKQRADNGQNFVDFLTARRIIPGIKVDQGLAEFEGSEETYTKGLDSLKQRLKEYYNAGLRFAKWRAAFKIRLDENGGVITPTDMAIQENCRILAEYAKACQTIGLVPIVEPEVVYDGLYDIDQSSFITSKILDCLFAKLENSDVNLRACILKVNMVLAGKKYHEQSAPAEVGVATAKVLKNHVPESLAGVVFLSGGQTPEQATDNLAAIIANGPFPWPVTFSFARALQDPALFAWAGDNRNTEKARQAFLDRLIANTNVLK
ncbi:fructose-bisphosphate aldolase class I [Candidatus Saccharibacteria bacterium]|nr:fructose-bisphosphate aldolase class I [Candidatus Saccharibacteria bacterium]